MAFSNIGHFFAHLLMMLYRTVVLGLEGKFGLTYGELISLSLAGYILFGGPQKREAYQLLQAFLKHRLQPLVDGGMIEGIEVKGKPPEPLTLSSRNMA